MIHARKNHSFITRREQGAAMVVALLMLLVLTIIGTATARMTLMEERMTGNTQDFNIAFQAAEGAVRAGEEYLESTAELPYFENDDGLYKPTAPDAEPRWHAVDWNDAGGEVAEYDALEDAPGTLADASAAYIIEELDPVAGAGGNSLKANQAVDGLQYFRVTARGVGVNGNVNATLQTTYKR